MADQLSLPVNLRAEATFQNFYAAPESIRAQVLCTLQEGLSNAEAAAFYLWGPSGAGCSHLLQAACHHVASHTAGTCVGVAAGSGFSSQFLPLGELADCDPWPLLEGMENRRLVCLAHLQAVLGNDEWELALFDFYHRLQDSGGALLVSADGPPASQPFGLPDLQSRFEASTIYHLPAYSDPEKIAILQFSAAALGLHLGEAVANYLLRRAPRNLNSLMSVLDQLDRVALQQQRRLTIPFIRNTLCW